METAAQPISQPRTKRHYRSADERRRIVEETLAPGISVASVARAHGINDNQLFAWRKLYQAGLLGSTATGSVSEASTRHVRLLSVTVADDTEHMQPAPVAVSTHNDADHEAVAVPGSIELTLTKARVLIRGQVEVGVLRVVLECLRG
jgi:transposase